MDVVEEQLASVHGEITTIKGDLQRLGSRSKDGGHVGKDEILGEDGEVTTEVGVFRQGGNSRDRTR